MPDMMMWNTTRSLGETYSPLILFNAWKWKDAQEKCILNTINVISCYCITGKARDLWSTMFQ